MASETSLGLQPRSLIGLLVDCQEEQGFLKNGPAFIDNLANDIKLGKYEALILGVLHNHNKQWEKELEGDHTIIFEGANIDEVYTMGSHA
jgi:hypothetical protein